MSIVLILLCQPIKRIHYTMTYFFLIIYSTPDLIAHTKIRAITSTTQIFRWLQIFSLRYFANRQYAYGISTHAKITTIIHPRFLVKMNLSVLHQQNHKLHK